MRIHIVQSYIQGKNLFRPSYITKMPNLGLQFPNFVVQNFTFRGNHQNPLVENHLKAS